MEFLLLLLSAITTNKNASLVSDIINRHYDEIMSYIDSKNNTGRQNEEIASDLFQRMYTYADRLEKVEEDKLLFYLYKAAENALIENVKDKKDHGLDNVDSIPLRRVIKAYANTDADDPADPESKLLRDELEGMLDGYLAELCELDRVILFERISIGSSLSDIAKKHGLSKSAVARKVNRMTKGLTKRYGALMSGKIR